MKYSYFWALPVAALLSLAGCSNDDTLQADNGKQQNTVPAGMTEFADGGLTRTAGTYDGSAIKFYWTSGDKLWINNASTLTISTKDNITAKAPTAKFYFPGILTAPKYTVRYTGNGNAHGDKVTISPTQSQSAPDDASHIGTDGDCGTAEASRLGDGSYTFTLSHKASYLVFTPYYSPEFAEDVKVTQIKVTADEALAGEFKFDDNGINTTLRPAATAANRSITLTLNGGSDDGFVIPKAADHKKNAAIMVLAPGEYHHVTVEYTLYDQKTKVRGTVSKTYSDITCKAGKNKKVSTDLAITHYSSDRYYLWDAAVGQNAWKGHENDQPVLKGATNANYPKISSDPRWYNPAPFPTSATRSAATCPNANEMLWYVMYGDPHWDPSLWSIMKHLYAGGMWLKKLSGIAAAEHKTEAEMKKAAPDGTDYTKVQSDPKIYDKYPKSNKNIEKGRPGTPDDYIFLPTIGIYLESTGQLWWIGTRGYYGSSTPRPDGTSNAYDLYVQENEVHTGYGPRAHARWLWPK